MIKVNLSNTVEKIPLKAYEHDVKVIDKMIKEARYGGANEGGMGATIISFK